MAQSNPSKKSDKKRPSQKPLGGRPGSNRGPRRPKKDQDFQWQKAAKTLGFWAFFIIGTLLLAQVFQEPDDETQIAYSEFQEYLEKDQVLSIIVEELELHGEFKESQPLDTPRGTEEVTRFKVVLPYEVDREMIDAWESAHVSYERRLPTFNWAGQFFAFLPWIVLIVVWVFILRRMQGGGQKGIFSFGKSRAKLVMESKQKVTFNEVAGAEEAKQELQEIIEFLKDPAKFQRLGGKIPKGALLLGPPGTGKTLMARAVAGEADVPFYSMSGADFVEMFVGVGASRVRDLFDQGKKNAPCIIFIDEIDAVGRHRGAGLGGGHDEREQTLNQLLVEMDGFETNEGVILLAATNRPDVLDSALLRPGRLDRQIVVDRPDVRGREGILKVHTKKIPLDTDVELTTLARGTPGLAGADLANLVNEAALLAARYDQTKVRMQNFEDAKDKVMMGAERKSLIINEKEKKQTAYHEAGHVLVSMLMPESDPIHKVTIIPRGRALGVTHSLPMDERHTYSRDYCLSMIAKAMGGRVAEKLIFNVLSTGAGNDIEQASALARKMVCEWGMSDKLGPVSFGKKQEEIFLGREIAQHRDYSEQIAQDIDSEVGSLIINAEKQVESLLRDNLDKLEALAEALLTREILDHDEIDQVMNGETLAPVQKDEVDVKSPGNGEHAAANSDSENDSPETVADAPVGTPGEASSDTSESAGDTKQQDD
jgi:cell division protease FtsH